MSRRPASDLFAASSKRLRDKLGTLRDYVATVRGSGDRFVDTASSARE